VSAPFLISYALLWALVIVQFAAILALYHHFARVYVSSREGRQAQGPDLGASLAPLRATCLDGTSPSVTDANRPGLLVFLSTTCAPCDDLAPALARLATSWPEGWLLLVCAGDPADVRGWSARHGLPDGIVAPDRGGRLTADHRVAVTPYCIAVSDDGTVAAKGVASNEPALEWYRDHTARLHGEAASSLTNGRGEG
jgi:thiol-disulfide isomerase/thioredoxin